MIAAVALLCKNSNVACYEKFLKGINMKLGILAYHDKVLLLDMWHTSESNIFGVMPFFTLEFLTDQREHRMQCSCL
jgi:hypothetical protein